MKFFVLFYENMKSSIFPFATVIVAIFTIEVTSARDTRRLARTVDFIPPLVRGDCEVGQWFTPNEIPCAMCLCMTGTMSRCVPQPGCNSGQNNPPQPVTSGPSRPNRPIYVSRPRPKPEEAATKAPSNSPQATCWDGSEEKTIPSRMSGKCNIFHWKIPENITCATCFCMNGTMSRCVSQPGRDIIPAANNPCGISGTTQGIIATTDPSTPAGANSSTNRLGDDGSTPAASDATTQSSTTQGAGACSPGATSSPPSQPGVDSTVAAFAADSDYFYDTIIIGTLLSQ